MTDPLFDVRGKVALVTGASSGLGENFARCLAQRGAIVVAAARRADRLEALVRDGGAAHAVALDVTDAVSVEAAVKRAAELAGPLDILVNNAGIADTKASLDLTEADWRRVLDTNLDGAWRMAQAVARSMIAAKRPGSIVNIASILGLRQATHLLAYAAAKAALVQVTKSLALEWARHGIRVNAIAPGYVITEMNRDFFASEPGRAMANRVPQRRIGSPSDLDGALLLLASGAGAYMTGSVVVVDGGHLVNSL
ncbi:MAG: glucose 1-dehydrogenase [Betaproteobacteria bacterium]|nr:glucose 1-dehydrogenase [Betaproteobacteria bacterium]PWB63150.1 MAG: 2-deoxy-D-gluconate 3-dehydrogenase [Betaproteobacteria bacterium]